ncbi:MAG TPA: 2-phospho-L-lactate transferase [Mycobacteriales bacterium]|jgi:LPPG:FO 2-phospho-L-lactate transferase|nr:2-phospho-L-lactate transferase [Mycobacteriales bacterium]
MRVTVLSGGVGGARFLLGLRTLGHDLTVIGNTGDDVTMLGLRICPDLDTVMYTLGDGISAERGWGREAETFRVRDELTTYAEALAGSDGADSVPSWFGLGDLDLATHLLRSQWLTAGVPLSEVTRRLCERWRPGVRLLPATDAQIETHVVLETGATVHFQEWWVRLHAAVAASRFDVVGAGRSVPAPGVVAAIHDADVVLLPPSNPVVSIGVILAVPGISETLRETAAPVIGLSPIVGGAPVRGMADACLAAIAVETTASAVARHYGARSRGGLLDGWLVDTVDGESVGPLQQDGILTAAVPLMMTDVAATAEMASAALALATEVRR